MSITFQSYDTQEVFLIGGQGSLTGVDDGQIGPSARYSIDRQEITTGDGTYLGSKFNINITGTAVLSSYSTTDLDTKGTRQANIQGLALKDIKLNKISQGFGNGKLEISAYGGMPNNVVFNDAKLLSIEISPQSEESAGVQYLEHSFVFEAYEDNSNNTNSNSPDPIQNQTWKLSSATESWELKPDERFTFLGSDIDAGAMHKAFTLTHSLSAVGIRKYGAGGIDAEHGHAWRQAAGWINDRIQACGDYDPDQAITEDITKNDQEIKAKFHPFYMNKDATTEFVDLKTQAYKARNKTRVIASDIAAGSYTVTDTWIVSLDTIKALHEINISIDNSVEDSRVLVNIQGNVTGLTEKDLNDNTDDKYTNALAEYKTLCAGETFLASKIGAAAKTEYDKFVSTGKKFGTLLPKPVNHQETHNKSGGTISFNTSFSDEEISVAGAISQNIEFQFTNSNGVFRTHQIQLPAAIGTLKNGPFIYNPGTTSEKRLTVNVDLVMDLNNRASKPNGRSAYSLPSYLAFFHAIRIVAETESWSPKTGAYNLTVEYVYV